MKNAILIMMMVATSAVAEQLNTLDALRQSYEKQARSSLVQYGTDLNKILTDLKGKGDLDNFLLVEAEQKRFCAEKTVTVPINAKASFHAAADAYYQAMVALLVQYEMALDGLIKKEMMADRIEEAKLVKAEKDKASLLLVDMQAKLSATGVIEKPKTEKLTKPIFGQPIFKAKTYVDETKGWAGMEPKNNVYTFPVEAVGRNATFRFWAAGDIGTGTSGQVLLKCPDGTEQIIRQWKPSDFKVAANTIKSYTKLKPISCDVSSYVKQPGKYQFAFRWGGSQVGLSILRVELELW